MGEPVRLNGHGFAGLVRAVAASTPAVLGCFAGRWRDGASFIGWTHEAGQAPADPTWTGHWIPADGPARRFGFAHWLAEQPDGSWLADGPGSAALIERDKPLPTGRCRLIVDAFTPQAVHLAAVEHAIAAIRAGQLFQVNICARLHGRLDGSAVELFLAGVAELAPDYAALLHQGGRTAVSLSPELFLHRHGCVVRTAPIKGTRARSVDPDELLHSRKDRAENVMITDLTRNDLSRVCRPGSVRVERLLEVRPAPGVWHLVSEVAGQVPHDLAPDALLAHTFPPGSVTGAPKLRAIELYQQLEAESRGLFTGSLGLSGPHGAEFNVAIRTFEVTDDRFELGVGGGITADSVPMLEWQECQIKAAPLLALGDARWPMADEPVPVDANQGIFDTMLVDDGRIIALADHLARLEASSVELFGRYLPTELAGRLQHVAAAHPRGRHRLRVTVRAAEQPRIEIAAAPAPGGRVALTLGRRPAGSWRHKWADRSWLASTDQYFTGCADGTDCLVETGIASLVHVPRAGLVRAPVLDSAVLPGVCRRRFLDACLDQGWQVELGRLDRADVLAGGLLLALSSLRQVVLVDRLDGVRLDVDDTLLAQLSGWLG
ncbi:MAG TPA: chorismate-binding protein [Jatrophihabitans sp.]|nr:chorismate-binding protein [Jatrophihabitans sp.]